MNILFASLLFTSPQVTITLSEAESLNDPSPYVTISCPTFHTNAELFAMNSGGHVKVKKTKTGQLIKKIHCYKIVVIPLTVQCMKEGHHKPDCKLRMVKWWRSYRAN